MSKTHLYTRINNIQTPKISESNYKHCYYL